MNRQLSPLTALLAVLKSLSGPKWEPGETDGFFADGLGDLEPELLVALAKRVGDREERRPSRAELLRIAADLASPTPNAQDALDEILRFVRERGRHARPTENPRIFVLGEPTDLSHPLILRVVRDVGGWSSICEVENLGVFRAQWERMYNTRREQWNEEVGEALRLPASARPPELFPAFEPKKLGGSFAGIPAKTVRYIGATVPVPELPPSRPLSDAEKARVRDMTSGLAARLDSNFLRGRGE